MKRPLYKLENLSFAYDQHPVLKEATAEIFDGEFIGIIGPNGGGKTTLLNLLMGFLHPTAGSITLKDHPPGVGRDEIGFVPQALRFDTQFPITLEEVVTMGALKNQRLFHGPSRKDRQEARAMIDKLGLTPLKDRPFGTLSGGQMQRTLVARALIGHPKILLLDEPTASIDFESQATLFSQLRELKGSLTILMVTHQIQPILKDVDRLLCVQTTLSSLAPEKVCEHYAMGVYHAP